ncbi:hypothetical protein JTB14_000387 [Gonioctena quinquepunctata]|nr:hypothetical protein JTB14_000387 [Gonioctena quinquepunctata]
MDTGKLSTDNELADLLTSEDFWADEGITMEDEAGPSGFQCMKRMKKWMQGILFFLMEKKARKENLIMSCLVFMIQTVKMMSGYPKMMKTLERIQSIARVKTKIVINTISL